MYEYFVDYIYAFYYPLLAAVGVPVNLVTIWILSQGRCGLSKCITLYLVAMAVADLLVAITEVILNRSVSFYFPNNILKTTPGCSTLIVLICAVRDTSVWLTVAFTLDRFVAICCQKLKVRYCVPRTAAVVIAVVTPLFFLKNIPWFFSFEPVYVIDDIPWQCQSTPIFFTSPVWVAYDWLHRILSPFLPFFFILIFNALTVRHILQANRVRKGLLSKQGGDQVDPETENRRKSMILLFAISGSFIALWMPYVINFLHYRIAKTYYYTDANAPGYILQQMGYLFQLSSCCVNTCIYVVTQAKFREELKRMFRTPCRLCVK
ncbi:probable G-protein coupled receptor 139 [Chiloscyllium plagiosum]|uniref:probable G-protein coupled receptor 139 n=1 Tax=Chiloscyllium plagiosum TaxID=36176 RepID=UPI001CB87814|nr:probable G-protein coupled receptor 139 [Chiloscyllium plagiosum]